jgi:branched-chain amino acid transport system substrate-binding protein
LEDVVSQIIADRPDFVFTTLIGQSGFALLKMLRAAAEAAGIDQPREMPAASCSLSEAELPLLGAAASGHLSSSVYFSTIDSPENRRFVARWSARFGHMGQASADAEAAYVAVHLLTRAAERAGSTGFEEVREAVRDLTFDAPQGRVTVDKDSLHCWMRPRIGRSRSDGTFDILEEHPVALRPDPYLTWAQEIRSGESHGMRLIQ